MATTFVRLLSGGDPDSGMQPSDMTPAEAFTSDDHTELNHTFLDNKVFAVKKHLTESTTFNIHLNGLKHAISCF